MQRALPFVALALLACGGEEPVVQEGRYLPLAVGASWTFRVTDQSGAVFQKSSTVEELEELGGKKTGIVAFRVRTSNPDGITLSWQEDRGSAVVRHREQELSRDGRVTAEEIYVPYKLRLDESPERLRMGAKAKETYTETHVDPGTGKHSEVTKTELWTVESIDEPVVAGGNTYKGLRVRRENPETGVTKTYWFARDVGKVREQGGQDEELVAHSVP
ncbi:MAG: hypothetical protein HY698_13660 [Deltaproteobacteria bacterium]|nr:hypothetical protein [Deltaproteobacteria bacterium]